MDSKMCRLKVLALAGTMFVVLLLTVQFVASCDRGSMPALTGGAYDSVAGDGDADTAGERVTMSVEGPLGGEFTFEPLDGDGSPDEKGGNAYELALEEGLGDKGQEVLNLTITAKDGFEWKYALGYIHYDADKYNPIEFKPGGIFGNDERKILTQAIFSEKGCTAFWTGFTKFDDRDAAKSGLIGTFVIELSAWEPPRGPSTAPDNDGSEDPELSDKVDDAAGWKDPNDDDLKYIYFSEVNRGDGNINGEVGIPDLTPLAQNWDESYPPPTWLEVLDYWGDNYIGDPDPDVITTNYLKTVGGYSIQVYADEGMQNLLLDTTITGPDYWERQDISTWDRGVYYGEGNWFYSTTGQIGYRIADESFQLYSTVYAILTPYDAESPPNDGVSSDLTRVDFDINEDPEAFLSVNYTVIKVPYWVSLDASASFDIDGIITKYEWDLDGNGSFETDTGTTPYAMSYISSADDCTLKVQVTDNSSGQDVAQKVIHAREYLNEAGFASDTVDIVAVEVQFTDYSIPIVFRDTDQALAFVNDIRILFSGDTDSLLIPGMSPDNIKPWDDHDTQWGDPEDGFLTPLYDGTSPWRYAGFASNLADLNVTYHDELEVDEGTSDIAMEYRFRVEVPHDEIYLTMVYDTNRTYYTNLNSDISEFYPWSTFPYEESGYTEAYVPPSS